MKIASSFMALEKKKESEKEVLFLFSSQEQILHCPQILVSSEVTRSSA